MPEIHLNIPGVPNSQKRHRHVRMGNFTRTYDPSATEKEDFLYKSIYECKPELPIISSISIVMEFYMPRPKAHFGTGKNAGKLKNNAPFRHCKAPDLDNLTKFVLDALNKIYWKDDRQIYSIRAKKMYNDNPRTEVAIKWEQL